MRYGIIGAAIIFMMIAGGIVLYTGFANETKASEGLSDETLQTSTATTDTTPTTTASPTAAPEKVSAEALTCTIVTPGGYEVDLKLKNPGTESRNATINPSGRIVNLPPGQTTRVDVFLANEGVMLNISLDDGTELQVQSPPCISRGGSGGSVSSGSSVSNLVTEQSQFPSPVSPTPELSTLALTSAGILGLLLVSWRRKD